MLIIILLLFEYLNMKFITHEKGDTEMVNL